MTHRSPLSLAACSSLAVTLVVTACTSDPPPREEPVVAPVELGPRDGLATTDQPATADAEVPDGPVRDEEASVTAQDGTDAPMLDPDATAAPRDPLATQPVTIHDRLITKAVDGAPLDEVALTELVEQVTGEEVLEIKRGPGGMMLVVMAPTEPARDAASQNALRAKLEATGRFKYVDADRMLTAR